MDYAELVLKAAAEINARSTTSLAPLHLTLGITNSITVRELIRIGADSHMLSSFFETSLNMAKRLGKADLPEKLKQLIAPSEATLPAIHDSIKSFNLVGVA